MISLSPFWILPNQGSACCRSFGSGAGSDLSWVITERIQSPNLAPDADYIARRQEIDYATYARYRGKIRR